ncbi:MAG: hypothetical protein IT223_01480, partial [Crocinitomicaceae bacterium]|nr:hypothetical protein [Crocinitomicaceae bacterium]
MDISVFFRPTAWHTADPGSFHLQSLFRNTTFFSGQASELDGKKVAILGVCEGRNAGINEE